MKNMEQNLKPLPWLTKSENRHVSVKRDTGRPTDRAIRTKRPLASGVNGWWKLHSRLLWFHRSSSWQIQMILKNQEWVSKSTLIQLKVFQSNFVKTGYRTKSQEPAKIFRITKTLISILNFGFRMHPHSKGANYSPVAILSGLMSLKATLWKAPSQLGQMFQPVYRVEGCSTV